MFWFVCVCAVSTWIPLCKPTRACVKPEVDVYRPLLLSTLCFEIGWSLTEPGVCHFSKMTDWPSSPWNPLVPALPVLELQMSVTATGFHMDAEGLNSGPCVYRASTSPLSHCPQLWSFHWSLVVQNVDSGALSPGSLPSHHLCIRVAVGFLYISRIRYITSLWKVSHVDDPCDCIS